MVEMGSILVTGAGSGFGEHCCEFFNGIPYTRTTSLTQIMAQAHQKPFHAIVHAAFNAKSNIPSEQLYAYLNDTILLTKQLLTIPHKKFIFISTVDVYPKNGTVHHEDDSFNMSDIKDLYAISKLMSESIVKSESKDYLILRPTAMLGVNAKPNSLMKILRNDKSRLTLAGKSVFNYIRHSDLSAFILAAIEQNLTGTYNTVSASNISLQDAAKHFGYSPQFGDYYYHTDQINNQKAANILKDFNNTSLENIKLFLAEQKKGEKCAV